MNNFGFSEGAAEMTVTELNELVKRTFDGNPAFGSVYVKGEISNFKNHRSTGTYYFSLKDETGSVNAVMFRSYASRLAFEPEDGMKVIVHGRVTVYVRSGAYQIYADMIQPDGVGAMYVALEQLKKRLYAEGVISPDRKRPLPKIPMRVGVITSPSGAAVRDIIRVAGDRFPMTKIIIYPSLVQGPDAPPQLTAGVNYFSSTRTVDVIIIGRGGGSVEDLWAFNDEELARAVAASAVPVVSAVGHEINSTVCDLVADVSVPTPTAAAEKVFPEERELRQKIENITTHNKKTLAELAAKKRRELESLATRRCLTDPYAILGEKRMTAERLTDRLTSAAKAKLGAERLTLSGAAAKLDALNPLSVLSRGYFAVYGGGGGVVKSVSDAKVGDELTMRAADGEISAEVKKIKKYGVKE